MKQHDFLARVLKETPAAIAFCEQVFRVSQIVDDLHDGDKRVDAATRDGLLWEMLVALPDNPFYAQHFDTLQPMVRTALADWLDSADLEATGDAHDASLAFVLRDQLTGVVVQCAYLIGGYSWMRAVSAEIRRYFHDETLDAYRASLGQEGT